MSSTHATISRPRRIVAVCSAKGGCGASMIATNLAVFLAQIGKDATLVDADIGGAGLHSWLGMRRPERTITDFVKKRVATLDEVVSPTPIAGLSLIAGVADLGFGYRPTDDEREDLVAELRNIKGEYVIVDLPSGLTPLTLDVFGKSDVSVVVCAPTPDAVEATYRLFMASFISTMLGSPSLDELSRTVIENLAAGPGRRLAPREIVGVLKEAALPVASLAENAASLFHPHIVVNMIRVKSDLYLGDSMAAAASRWLGVAPRLLGVVDWDDNVWQSLRRGNPLLVDFPKSRACRGLERMVRRFLAQDFRASLEATDPPRPTEEQNLYELLDLYPGASEEEVRRAYKQIREYFGLDGLAASGVCSEEERDDYQRRVKEAHEILVDRTKRREYDRIAFPNGIPEQRRHFDDARSDLETVVVSPHDSLPEVSLREDQMVTGPFLKDIRHERGIELQDISNRARISMSYLRAIEEEKFDELPPPVYIRGFIREYARYLKIDPERAVSDFMATFDAHRSSKEKSRR